MIFSGPEELEIRFLGGHCSITLQGPEALSEYYE